MRWKLGLVVTFCVVAVYLFVASYSVPSMIFQPLGGDAYLRIVSVLLFVASIGWLAVIALSRWMRRTERSDATGEQMNDNSDSGATSDAPGQQAAPDRGERIVPWFALSTVVYAVAVFTVGYFVSTFAFLLGSMMMFVDDWKTSLHRLILLAAGITVALLILFRAVRFYVPDAWLF